MLTISQATSQKNARAANWSARSRLSDREYEIFHRIVAGQSITEIANERRLSVKTVSTHKTHILEKMETPNENALVRYAIRHILNDDEDDFQKVSTCNRSIDLPQMLRHVACHDE